MAGFQPVGEGLPSTASTPMISSSTAIGSDSRHVQQGIDAIRASAPADLPPATTMLCPECGGLGAIAIPPPPNETQYGPRYQRCPCQDEAERMRWGTEANIPPRFRGLTFSSYRQQPGADLDALARVKRWCADGGTDSLILYGNHNRMKTGLATSACLQRISQGQRGWFLKVPDLLADIRASYDRTAGGVRSSEIMEAARTVPLLVLDDLGAEQLPKDTSWLEDTLYRLIDHRHDYLRPMLVTTNLGEQTDKPFTELASRIERRIPWRLREMAGGHVIRVGGENQRAR